MPRKKAIRCRTCNYVLKEVSVGNGWAHKKKEHWVDRPHKAVPASVPTPVSATA